MGRLVCLLWMMLAVWLSAGAQSALQMPPRAAMSATPLPPLPHPTLDRIRAAQAVRCGVVKEEEDYSRSEDHGNRAAFDIDLCKAVAVAALGPGARLIVVTFPDEPFALRALRSGEVDLIATASLTLANMAQEVAFSAPVLDDAQGLLVPDGSGVQSAAGLAGKRVCFLTGSAAEGGLHRYAEAHGLSFVWFPFSETGEMAAAFFTGHCDALSGDLTQLANLRALAPRRAVGFTILPERLRPDPLAIATWAGDASFSTVVYWTAQVLLNAEALGVSRGTLGDASGTERPEVRQLLGPAPAATHALGLRPQWGGEVLAAVGNYGEVFERDLGAKSALRLPRRRAPPPSEGLPVAVPLGSR